MRIVTLNTWKNEGEYDRRLGLMASGLGALHADIICLQECFIGAGRDTAATLAAALGLRSHAQPARAKPRLHDGVLLPSTSGLAILSRWPAMGGALCLESHPADGERIGQRLDIVVDGLPLRILNLHLTHLRGPDFAVLRARQLEAALSWADEGRAGGLVVAGDMNATAADSALAALNAQVGFELATLLGPRADTPARAGPAIDHLVLQAPGGWSVASRFRALDETDPAGWYPSDHAAVVVDLSPA